MNTALLYVVGLVIAFGLGITAGANVNNWRRDSIELAAKSAADVAIAANREREQSIASAVEARIEQARTKTRTVERETIREIRTNEKVYGTECITDAGRMRYNDLATSGGASEPAAKVQ